MDKPNVVMFYDLCRLCLENLGTVDVFKSEDLVRDIYICTAVKVSKKEKLPQNICTTCSDTINRSKKLKILASKNDSYLRSLFGDDIEDSSEETIDVITTSNDSETINIVRSIFIADDNLNIKKELDDYETHSSTSNMNKDIIQSSTVMNSPRKKRKTSEDSPPHIRPKPDHFFPRPIKVEKNLNELVCQVCHKSFITPKKLYLHQRLHFKNIECPRDKCDKKFATKGDLEKHVRTHTGERPYKCEICERSFAQKGTLKSHRITVHGDDNSLLVERQ